MLIARWSIWGYGIFEGRTKVAHAYFNWWSSGGKLVIHGKRYGIASKGFPVIKRYEIRCGKNCIATIRLRWSPLPTVSALELDNQLYNVQNEAIMHNGLTIGTYRGRRLSGWLWSGIELELPPQMPLIPKLLLAWSLIDANRASD